MLFPPHHIAPRSVLAWATTLCLLLNLLSPASGQEAPPKVDPKKAAPKKPDPAFEKITDDPKLPRVLLIGDSISIGYTVPTRNLLQGKANVHRIPTNGGPTTNGLAQLKIWLGNDKWDVIHFNWGLHDLRYLENGRQLLSIAEYEQNLRELVSRLKTTGAKLIWCSTTPVPDADLKPPRKNSDVIAFNAVASKVMQENQIPIDDLYTYALPELTRIQLPANVHYNNEGYAFLAKKVAASIEAALPKR